LLIRRPGWECSSAKYDFKTKSAEQVLNFTGVLEDSRKNVVYREGGELDKR
jgi:hypothetical protein